MERVSMSKLKPKHKRSRALKAQLIQLNRNRGVQIMSKPNNAPSHPTAGTNPQHHTNPNPTPTTRGNNQPSRPMSLPPPNTSNSRHPQYQASRAANRSMWDVLQSIHEHMMAVQAETEILSRKLASARAELFGTPLASVMPATPYDGDTDEQVAHMAEKFAAGMGR